MKASKDRPEEVIKKEDVIKKISNYIEEFNQKKLLKPEYKKLVCVVGNSGTGKSTLVSFLAGDDLVAEKVNSKWIIDNKTQSDIEIGHGLESQTFFPSFKNVSGTIFCDLPGFGDTRGLVEEIAKAIFMKRVSDYVDEVKILVTIAYSDIDARAGGLRSLVKSLSSFINKLDDFNDGISIVVTKVDTTETDSDILQDISKILSDFASENDASSFLQPVINQNRLSIFRKPSREGSLKDIDISGLGKVFVDEQQSIQTMLKASSYLSKSKISFGYSITSDAQLDSIGIAKELQNEMSMDMEGIFEDIKKYYSNKIAIATDIYELKKTFENHNWSKAQFNGESPILFLQGVIDKLNEYRVSINQDKFKRFSAKNEFLCFLQDFSEQVDKYSNYQSLDSLLDFLDKERMFNQALVDLVEIKLNDENLIKKLDKLKGSRNDEDISAVVSDFTSFTKSQKSQINQLLDCMFKAPESKVNQNQRIVVGHIIKLSEVLDLINGKDLDSLCIYAAKAVIMDNQDLKLPSKNISILSPEWYMFGANTIKLDGLGLDAEPHSKSKADSGATEGANGSDGLPGNPGHSGGNFLGVVTTFYNPSSLKVSSIGGYGGSGQDGGDGYKGKDGDNAPDYPTKKDMGIEVKVLSTDTYVDFKDSWKDKKYVDSAIQKKEGGVGLKGGDAGRGGQGGNYGSNGQILIIGLENFQKSNEAKVDSKAGKDGKAGNAGKGGKHGKDKFASYSYENTGVGTPAGLTSSGSSMVWSNKQEKAPVIKAADGSEVVQTADDGSVPNELNSSGIQKPTPVDMIWYKPFVEYKKYIGKNLGNKYFRYYTEEFFKKFNEIQGRLSSNKK